MAQTHPPQTRPKPATSRHVRVPGEVYDILLQGTVLSTEPCVLLATQGDLFVAFVT